jgi:hypothetical protein
MELYNMFEINLFQVKKMLKVQKVTKLRVYTVPPRSQRRQKVPSSTLTCTRVPIRLGPPSWGTATPGPQSP